MKKRRARKYQMTSRAQSAENTSADIIRVLGELWIEHSIHDITLDMIAAKAGITVRTILRKFGSKEGLFEAALKTDAGGLHAIKDQAETGNIERAASLLMQEYEVTGMAGIRTLAIENELPIAAKILKKGREMHMKWCERVFSPYLPKSDHKKYKIMLGAFYSVTDVYKWKLLRKDLGYSKEETETIFINILKGLVNTNKKQI